MPSERLRASLHVIEASTHFAPLARTDAVLICVPTPLTPNREPDLGPLIASGRALGQVVQRGRLVVLESTTFPGTDPRASGAPARAPRAERRRWAQRGLLARAGPIPDRLHVAQHAEGRRRYHAGVHGARRRALQPDLRRGGAGLDARSGRADQAAWEYLPLAQRRARQREILAERMAIDIWEVVDAASTTPYVSCASRRDPAWVAIACRSIRSTLTWRAHEFEMSIEFIELAGKINQPDAPPLRGANRARPQSRPQAGQGITDPDPRCQVQGWRGRHARVTSAAYNASPRRARRDLEPSREYRSALPSLGIASASLDSAVDEANALRQTRSFRPRNV